MTKRLIAAVVGACALAGCAATDAVESGEAAAPSFEVGNGENNYIVLEGVTRAGATFVFKTVAIDRPGWLVIHKPAFCSSARCLTIESPRPVLPIARVRALSTR